MVKKLELGVILGLRERKFGHDCDSTLKMFVSLVHTMWDVWPRSMELERS